MLSNNKSSSNNANNNNTSLWKNCHRPSLILSTPFLHDDFYSQPMSWGVDKIVITLPQRFVAFPASKPPSFVDMTAEDLFYPTSSSSSSQKFDHIKKIPENVRVFRSSLICTTSSSSTGGSNNTVVDDSLFLGTTSSMIVHCLLRESSVEVSRKLRISPLVQTNQFYNPQCIISNNNNQDHQQNPQEVLSGITCLAQCGPGRSPSEIVAGTADGILAIFDIRCASPFPVLEFGKRPSVVSTFSHHHHHNKSSAFSRMNENSSSTSSSIFERAHPPTIFSQTAICGVAVDTFGSGMIASAGNDGVIQIWNPQYSSYQPVASFSRGPSAVKALSWCPTRRGYLAVGGGSVDGTLSVVDCSAAVCGPDHASQSDHHHFYSRASKTSCFHHHQNNSASLLFNNGEQPGSAQKGLLDITNRQQKISVATSSFGTGDSNNTSGTTNKFLDPTTTTAASMAFHQHQMSTSQNCVTKVSIQTGSQIAQVLWSRDGSHLVSTHGFEKCSLPGSNISSSTANNNATAGGNNNDQDQQQNNSASSVTNRQDYNVPAFTVAVWKVKDTSSIILGSHGNLPENNKLLLSPETRRLMHEQSPSQRGLIEEKFINVPVLGLPPSSTSQQQHQQDAQNKNTRQQGFGFFRVKTNNIDAEDIINNGTNQQLSKQQGSHMNDDDDDDDDIIKTNLDRGEKNGTTSECINDNNATSLSAARRRLIPNRNSAFSMLQQQQQNDHDHQESSNGNNGVVITTTSYTTPTRATLLGRTVAAATILGAGGQSLPRQCPDGWFDIPYRDQQQQQQQQHFHPSNGNHPHQLQSLLTTSNQQQNPNHQQQQVLTTRTQPVKYFSSLLSASSAAQLSSLMSHAVKQKVSAASTARNNTANNTATNTTTTAASVGSRLDSIAKLTGHTSRPLFLVQRTIPPQLLHHHNNNSNSNNGKTASSSFSSSSNKHIIESSSASNHNYSVVDNILQTLLEENNKRDDNNNNGENDEMNGDDESTATNSSASTAVSTAASWGQYISGAGALDATVRLWEMFDERCMMQSSSTCSTKASKNALMMMKKTSAASSTRSLESKYTSMMRMNQQHEQEQEATTIAHEQQQQQQQQQPGLHNDNHEVESHYSKPKKHFTSKMTTKVSTSVVGGGEEDFGGENWLR